MTTPQAATDMTQEQFEAELADLKQKRAMVASLCLKAEKIEMNLGWDSGTMLIEVLNPFVSQLNDLTLVKNYTWMVTSPEMTAVLEMSKAFREESTPATSSVKSMEPRLAGRFENIAVFKDILFETPKILLGSGDLFHQKDETCTLVELKGLLV